MCKSEFIQDSTYKLLYYTTRTTTLRAEDDDYAMAIINKQADELNLDIQTNANAKSHS